MEFGILIPGIPLPGKSQKEWDLIQPHVNLFTINGIEIIDAPREIGQTWHAQQRSLSGGSKLTLIELRLKLIE